jgi:hypothetical protein
MFNTYKIAKFWHSFWQRYNLRSQFRNIKKLFLFLFIVWLIGSLLTILSQWMFMSDLHSPADYLKYFWIVIIELVSGFDVPGEDLHLASRIISVIMLFMGIIVVGLFTGQIISVFLHVLQTSEYVPEKPATFQFRNPIIICGINDKLINITKHLRASPFAENREITIVSDIDINLKKEDFGKDTWILKGDPAADKTLKSYIGSRDSKVILLQPEVEHAYVANSRTINAALSIEAYDERIHTVLEICGSSNKDLYRNSKINDWICISEFGAKLISQSALQLGQSQLFNQLLGGTGDASHIFFSGPLPAGLRRSYKKLKILSVEGQLGEDLTLIGFAKYLSDAEKQKHQLVLRNTNYFIQLNPPNRRNGVPSDIAFIKKDGQILFFNDIVVTKNDQLIYMAERPIDWQKLNFDKQEDKTWTTT